MDRGEALTQAATDMALPPSATDLHQALTKALEAEHYDRFTKLVDKVFKFYGLPGVHTLVDPLLEARSGNHGGSIADNVGPAFGETMTTWGEGLRHLPSSVKSGASAACHDLNSFNNLSFIPKLNPVSFVSNVSSADALGRYWVGKGLSKLGAGGLFVSGVATVTDVSCMTYGALGWRD